MVTWLAVVLLGCPAPADVHTAAKGPEPVVAIEAPVDVGATRSPYDSALLVPDLAERESDFDLELLGSRVRRFDIKADVSVLASLDPGEADTVRQHLSADPRWRVGVWDGALVAFKRDFHDGAWGVARHGYHIGAHDIWRTALRFSQWDSTSQWANLLFVPRFAAAEPRLKIQAFKMGQEPWRGLPTTALTIEGSGVALDLFEATEEAGLPQTARALTSVPLAVAELHGRHDEVAADGFVSDQMPVNEPVVGEAAHVDVTSPAPGLLEVRGRYNPGRAGWTWLRLIGESRRSWETLAVSAGTRERVGFSNDPSEQFYFQSQFPVPSGAGFTATAEVWLTPDDGRPPEKLAAFPVAVPAR